MTSPDFGHRTLVITPNSLIPLQAEVIYAAESPLIPEGASLSFTVTEASLVPCEGYSVPVQHPFFTLYFLEVSNVLNHLDGTEIFTIFSPPRNIGYVDQAAVYS